jgi:hypothetical protein
MMHHPTLRDLAAVLAGAAMVAAASPGVPGAVVAVAALAVLTRSVITAAWPGTLAAAGSVLMAAIGHANPVVTGSLVLAYLLLADRAAVRLRASVPLLGGALLAMLVVAAVGALSVPASVWLVLAACAALPAAIALATRMPTGRPADADSDAR